MDKGYYWDLLIVRWLYKLSLKHPRMSDEFKVNGFGEVSVSIKLYGDLTIHDTLYTEMKSLEAMMRDKPKKFVYDGKTSPTLHGATKTLKYYFDIFKKELRDDKLDNLLKDDE